MLPLARIARVWGLGVWGFEFRRLPVCYLLPLACIARVWGFGFRSLGFRVRRRALVLLCSLT